MASKTPIFLLPYLPLTISSDPFSLIAEASDYIINILQVVKYSFYVPLSFCFYTIPLTSKTDPDCIKLSTSSIRNQASSFFLGGFYFVAAVCKGCGEGGKKV